ncbi:hypothetical protein EDF46_2713 [Frondihabitans sp. PhB188]|uniref:hypothetical protein n=1 Tax=Frondihabitans sp. PhB188 TaxID=2485200 RepID=UPI000FA21FD6|nr:hypothetical protein [Frondihabitans sp. PhB188]ROQ37257.1 hypothetical protein EDF46_2713 [Frondihabitans sp. PhB188]
MKFLLLIHNDHAELVAGLPPEREAAYTAAHGALIGDLMASGEFIDTNELDVADTDRATAIAARLAEAR